MNNTTSEEKKTRVQLNYKQIQKRKLTEPPY